MRGFLFSRTRSLDARAGRRTGPYDKWLSNESGLRCILAVARMVAKFGERFAQRAIAFP